MKDLMDYLCIQEIKRPVKHSIMIAGHKTSFTLEDIFWKILKKYVSCHNITVSDLITQLDGFRANHRGIDAGLSSIIRHFLIVQVIKNADTYHDIF